MTDPRVGRPQSRKDARCRIRSCVSYAAPESLHCPAHTRRFGTGRPPVCPRCGEFARRHSKDGWHKRCRDAADKQARACPGCGLPVRKDALTGRHPDCRDFGRARHNAPERA